MGFYRQKYSKTYFSVFPSYIFGWTHTEPYCVLEDLYVSQTHEKPTSFFDCGCGDGRLLAQAERAGVEKVHGIDMLKYPFVKHKNIDVVGIQDFQPDETFDLLWINDVLWRFDEKRIGKAMERLTFARVIIAKHNTREDLNEASARFGEYLGDTSDLKKPRDWWIGLFDKYGYKTIYNERYKSFVATRR